MARSDALWFSFAGVESGDMGLRVTKQPDIPVAQARGKAVEIAGRDGTLWLSDDAFDDVEIRVDFELVSSAEPDEVAAWLAGEGELILSGLEDYCWRARVIKGFELTGGIYAMGRRRGRAIFSCKPFRYEAGGGAMPPITAPSVFRGKGTWFAQPIVTVYGAGEIHLMLNGVTVLLSGVSDYITLDCEAMMAFKGGMNASPQVTILSEDDQWPRLSPGQNRVNWSGDVARVVVEPQWRWR